MLGFPGGSDGKESTYNAGDLGSIPGLGRCLEEGMATHSSILAWRIPMDRGAWRATVHRVAKSQTQLSDSAQHTQHLAAVMKLLLHAMPCMWGEIPKDHKENRTSTLHGTNTHIHIPTHTNPFQG